MPAKSLAMIASEDDSTMAANSERLWPVCRLLADAIVAPSIRPYSRLFWPARQHLHHLNK